MNEQNVQETKIDRVLLKQVAIKADANGDAPKNIEILNVGAWRTPNHGDFLITDEDLTEYVQNFEKGTGLPNAGSEGAPVDYMHESWDKAAGWIKKIFVQGQTLMASVAWTPAAVQKIRDGEFKFISPEFYPKGRGGWQDPENYESFYDNVLVGAGLTNIPLFKGLSPVKASAANGQVDDTNVIFINASRIEEIKMNLAEIKAKDASALTDAEKDFLTQNKAELTAEEQVKFGLEAAPAPQAPAAPVAEAPAQVETPAEVPQELAAVAASLKSGEMVAIKASEYNEMKQATDNYRTEKAQAVVKAHIARGAIKADQLDKWTGRLLKDATLEDDLKSLPSNEVMASEMGDSSTGEVPSAASELDAKAKAKVEASAGKTDYKTAMSEVLRENPDLANRYAEEGK